MLDIGRAHVGSRGRHNDHIDLFDWPNPEVIERFDHKHLNKDTLEFHSLNPTGENIVKVIWELLKPRLGNHLARIGLWETPKNFFEYYGE